MTAALDQLLQKFGHVGNATETAYAVLREANLKGNVFNHYGFGGFLISAGIPTFIDGRGELFGGEFIKDYVDAANLRGKDGSA